MQKRLECVVYGRVQGVSYRAFIRETARRLGLVGFVKNLPDETVEAVVEGEEEKLQEFLEILSRGHLYSRVERVDVKWGDATGEFRDFKILA